MERITNKYLPDVLDSLPEPILIIGNRKPDGDSLGCCVAVLDYFRHQGIEAYIHCVEKPDRDIAWMLDPEDVSEFILDDYASIVVLDDKVEEGRLGIPIRNVPIVCIDHHHSNFSPEVKKLVYETKTIVTSQRDNIYYFQAALPATACLLINYLIFHPYLFISLYTDTVGFTVNIATVMPYVTNLVTELNLTDSDLEDMVRKLDVRSGLVDLQSFFTGSLFTLEGSYSDKPISVVIAVVDDIDNMGFYKVLNFLRKFANVVCFVNRTTGKVSLRSENESFNVAQIANEFGGGGHLCAAGAAFNTKNIKNDIDRLVSILIDTIEQPRTKWYS